LSPWWLRPTAEGANEENREPSQPEAPAAPSAPESAPQDSTPAPASAAAEPPVSQGTEPEPEPAWRTEAEDAADAAEAEEVEPEPYVFRDRGEPAADITDIADIAYTSYVAEPGDLLDLETAEAGEEEPADLQAGDAESPASPEAKRKRSRGRRRRKNGRGTAAAPETPEAGEEDDEDDELFREDPFDEPAPPPPPPARATPAPRRAAHPPAHPAPPPPPPQALAPAPLQRSFRGESFVIPTGMGGDLDSYTREIVISVPDRQRSGSDERKIAMFCDLENIALGVRDSEISKFEIGLILERLLEKGKIIVKKAYADWERYSEYKRPFHEAAIELIDIPQKFYSGKNSADIKMVVDAMDLSYAKEHLDTFVIVSGDSDFSPLVSKLKENNKYVIGIGVKNSSSSLLIDNCDEFIYYEDVWRDNQKGPKLDGLNKKTAEAFSLMIESIQALIRENKDVLWGSMIKQTMQRKKPSFNEGYYGYSSFSELLEDAERKQILKLKKDQRSGTYIVTGFAKTEAAPARR
jgi:uncharacterized protein (TIGR00288 family)